MLNLWFNLVIAKTSVFVFKIVFMFRHSVFQIELYNSMVDKEGVDEKEAMKAYRAAHEENEQASDVAASSGVSSALRDRVSLIT